MSAVLKTATTSIVVLGHFTPAVFHPLWFSARDLLTEDHARAASNTVKSIMEELMSWEADWLIFEARPRRCIFTAKESAYHAELRDLVAGTFTLQPEALVAAAGLNRDAHYQMSNEAEWHEIGDRFVPNEPWAEITGGARAGLRRLVVEVKRPGDEETGVVRIEVAPSTQVDPYGVFVGINDHYQLAEGEQPAEADRLVRLLDEAWEPARERANAIVRHIIR